MAVNKFWVKYCTNIAISLFLTSYTQKETCITRFGNVFKTSFYKWNALFLSIFTIRQWLGLFFKWCTIYCDVHLTMYLHFVQVHVTLVYPKQKSCYFFLAATQIFYFKNLLTVKYIWLYLLGFVLFCLSVTWVWQHTATSEALTNCKNIVNLIEFPLELRCSCFKFVSEFADKPAVHVTPWILKCYCKLRIGVCITDVCAFTIEHCTHERVLI